MTNIEAARTWWDAGCAPLPVAPDGTKRPAVKTWTQWQQHRPGLDETLALFAHTDSDGIGTICGTASGGLEMLEFEGVAVAEGLPTQVAQAFTDHDRADLWTRITSGYGEATPSGGLHWYYRVAGGCGPNTKLARRPGPDNTVTVLVETRGEGGWSVVAPTGGRSHPTGRSWIAVVGTPATIPTITTDDRDLIHAICGLFDQMPEVEPRPATPTPGADSGGLRPGDDFNRRTPWEDILVPQGWTLAHRRGNLCTWVRPGKNKRDGISATTGRNDGDNLYVFSSSTTLPAEQPLSKLFVHAHYLFGGDMSAAAAALRAQGYGDPTPEPVKLTLLPDNPTPVTQSATPAIDGTAALAAVTQLQPAPVSVEDNEDSLAQLFVDHVAETVRYVPQRDKWLTWAESRWQWDEIGHHRELIKDVARRLPRGSKTAQAFRRRMLSSAGIGGVANMARTDPRVVVHLDRLDAQPWELNTPAGVVDLRTGTISPPDPRKLHTRSTTVAPDFTTPAPRWHQFLADTFGGDQELIDYVRRLLGVAAVGEVLEQALPFGHGIGANGKSVFVETCTDVLGRGEQGYAIAANPEMLMARKFQEHPTELAQLAGARLVICSELEDGARFAEARVKQLTGRDSISARFMKKDFFTFTPSHTFLLVANHRPQATVGGPAFWRRLRLIPFQHVVPEEDRDPHLPEKLREEWPAILAWIIGGAAAYAQGGMRTPEMVLAATEQYARDEDSMGRFVAEQCHLAPGNDLVRIRTGKLRAAYEQMCRELGDEPVSARRFTQELRDRFGITSARTGAHRFSVGVTLLEVEDDEADEVSQGESEGQLWP